MPEFLENITDCWQRMKADEKPLFLYGMGNGADKIIKVMEHYGISLAGVFASDEFVRGHSFAGHIVHKLSELEETVKDFSVVLGFGAGYQSLYDKISELAKKHTVYIPDVPLFGDGLFTRDYCRKHKSEILEVRSMLADDISVNVFENIIKFKVSGDMKFADLATTPKSEVYENIIRPCENDVYVDLGAYNGDTIREILECSPVKKIFAVEPDRRNFRKLVKYAETLPENLITTENCIAWSENTTLYFSKNSGRQSTIVAESENGNPVTARAVDTFEIPATIIKTDVEGAEKEALKGLEKTIANYSPKLMISVYHRNEDMFALPLQIHSINPRYKYYMRHQLYVPAWETNLYAVPENF